MFSYILLTLGGLLFGSVAYRNQAADREPWWLLLIASAAGAITFAIALLLQYAALFALHNLSANLTDYASIHALLASTLEEPAKLAVPLAVLLFLRKHFTDPMAGLLYGAAAGAGAALFESAFFMLNDSAQPWLALIHDRQPGAVQLLLHTCWGGLAGYALMLITLKKPWEKTLASAIALHFLWQLFTINTREPYLYEQLITALTLATTVVWFGTLTVQTNRLSRQLHAPKNKPKPLTHRILKALITRKFK